MDRRAQALNRLRYYETMCVAVENLRGQIQWLKLNQEGVHSVRTDRVVVCGQGGSGEDRLVNTLEHRRELEDALERTLQWLQVTDRALGALEKEELLVLRKLYIQKSPGAVSQLCQLLQMEKSSVYRKRDKALAKFTMALFGAESAQPVGA